MHFPQGLHPPHWLGRHTLGREDWPLRASRRGVGATGGRRASGDHHSSKSTADHVAWTCVDDAIENHENHQLSLKSMAHV